MKAIIKLKSLFIPFLMMVVIPTYGFSFSSLSSKNPKLLNKEPSDTLIKGLNNWQEVQQVITDKNVNVKGFTEEHPKEPAAFYYDGFYYVAVAVWNKYGGSFAPKKERVSDKEVVLLRSDSWKGPFKQISQVTYKPGIPMHAPGIFVDKKGELYIFFSDGSGNGNDIHLKHASVDNIPDSPSGWKDEGIVLSGEEYRDPCFMKGADGKNYLFVTDGSLPGNPVSRFSSYNMKAWGNKVGNIYDKSRRSNEGVDLVSNVVGRGYWLVTIGNSNNNNRHLIEIAGKADSLQAEKFTGKYKVSGSGRLNNIQKPWYSDWAAHFDYVYESGEENIHSFEESRIAFFEAGNGHHFSVGVARAPY